MSSLSVTDALHSRRSVRAFSDQPVAQSLLQEILTLAGSSASGGNVQPWRTTVLTGEALSNLAQTVQAYIQNSGGVSAPEFPTYPSPLDDPYNSRRRACGELMYAALEIPREDKMNRIMQVMKNYEFFGAPVGIIISMPRAMGEAQAIDIGIYLQTLMLLAEERGLSSCPQLSWSVWPQPIRAALGFDEDEKIMVGLSLGYQKQDAAINDIQQPRAALEEYVNFRGFE